MGLRDNECVYIMWISVKHRYVCKHVIGSIDDKMHKADIDKLKENDTKVHVDIYPLSSIG